MWGTVDPVVFMVILGPFVTLLKNGWSSDETEGHFRIRDTGGTYNYEAALIL